MGNIINVSNLSKSYTITRKESGLKGSIKSIFSKTYEEKVAVDKISFSINEGEFVGFIGPNGAGKTTTVKMLSGIVRPSEGEISVLSYTPYKLKNEFKRQISVTMGQKNQLWWDIPARDSFQLLKVIYNIDDDQFNKDVIELSNILDVTKLLDVPLRNLSLGERMKMEIIGSIINNPKVLFLDEPTIGLDVTSRKNIREFLKYINNERKTTIMLTSHYFDDIESLCNRIIAINKGKIIYDGGINLIQKKYSSEKYVSVSSLNKELLFQLNKYGKITSQEDNTIKMIIDKDSVKEFGKNIFANDNFYDVSIEQMPLEDSFEMLFKEKGK